MQSATLIRSQRRGHRHRATVSVSMMKLIWRNVLISKRSPGRAGTWGSMPPAAATPTSVASGVLRSRPTKCYVRVAPLDAAKRSQRAASTGAASADIRVHAASSGEPILSLPEFMSKKGYRTKSTMHRCDGVFDGACDAELYQTVGAPLVELALNGSSSCVFAYGQTGTGKS